MLQFKKRPSLFSGSAFFRLVSTLVSSTASATLPTFTIFVITVGLMACTTAPPKTAPGPVVIEDGLDVGAALTQADYIAAAAKYNKLAEQLASPQREAYQLLAAENLLYANLSAQSKALAERVDATLLSEQWQARKQLILADVALRDGAPKESIRLLEGAIFAYDEVVLRQRYHQVRAAAYLLMGNYLESARERVWLDELLQSPGPGPQQQRQLDNQRALLRALMSLSPQLLQQLRLTPPPDIFSGWMELAHLMQQFERDGVVAPLHLEQWFERYPEHPVLAELIEPMLLPPTQQPSVTEPYSPRHIALLLPLSGGFSAQASAIRDGFFTAYYQSSSHAATVQVFNVDDFPGGGTAAYAQAVAAGADFVVGPLSKKAVNAMAQLPSLPVPVLTLNYAEKANAERGAEQQPALAHNLYQFGLAPEDEARQVAEQAWLEGFSQAVVITPDNSWGRRILETFEARWKEVGGNVVEAQSYAPRDNDFSSTIKGVLNLDESEQRQRGLRRILGLDLQVDLRRRKDVDFVFMAAFPRQARLLRPQLKFHHAHDLPIFATSHIYSGKPDPRADRDMNGVFFNDIPWLLSDDVESPLAPLREKISALWPQAAADYGRLFALGVDAYQIIPHLVRLQTYPYERLDGA
ncbi:MAG: ABC transporter substrate-binding protein, partial [Gammaproteobacteria bacterium]|nr:ABC transporter substrate-binding protein [Gammaproteobacteria bacterium]